MHPSMVLSLLLVTMTAGMPEEHQYCAVRYRRLCQGKGRHVACQFPDPGPGSSCERYVQIKFTNDLKHFITHYLNRRRQRIAVGNERVRGGLHLPKPQIMMLVEWDRELAQLAQRLADQCHFVHDDCRATVKFPYAGQTVGEVRWRKSSESDELSAQRAVRRVLDAWWGERRRVQPKQLTAPFRLTAKGNVWGHFSQLAVWNLQAVGCGAVRHGARHPRLLLVCDFSHTNMLGQRTLVPGAMAACPIHTARRPRSPYPALCGPVRHPTPTEPEEIELDDSYDDDEDDDDESEYVEAAEAGEIATTMTVRTKKPAIRLTPKEVVRTTIRTTTQRDYPEITRHMDRQEFRGNGDFDNVVTPAIREPTRVQMENERETDLENEERRKAMFKNEQLYNSQPQTEYVTHKKMSRPFMQWRKNQEDSDNEVEEAVPLTAPRRPSPPSRASLVTYRPTIREEPTENIESALLRHRWKQTRVRPQRPGVNALLHTPTTTKIESKKPVVGSLSLDKDDIDQLFRDTGFNLNWRKKDM